MQRAARTGAPPARKRPQPDSRRFPRRCPDMPRAGTHDARSRAARALLAGGSAGRITPMGDRHRVGTIRAASHPSCQALAEKDACHSGVAVDPAELPVTMTLIELGRLEVDGDHDGPQAPPAPRLVLGLSHDATAETVLAQG